MTQDYNALPGAAELREGLMQALLDQAFAALLVFDIDQFELIDQTRGRETRDWVIEQVAAFASEQGWGFYRLGRDVFAVFFPEADDRQVNVLSELGQTLEARAGMPVTFSGGGVCHPGEAYALVPRMADMFFSSAHRLLALAKKQGHNQIVWLCDDLPQSPDMVMIARDFYRDMARIQSELARQLELESRTDFLTGLHNRRGFEEAFQRIVRRARTSGKSIALMYMDSDSLKTINDTRGHDAGDRFIVALSRVLREMLRNSDLISRWGADEFAAVIENTTQEEAQVIARRLHRAIAQRTEGTMSMGVYFGVPDSAEEALKLADRALYRVKHRGKNDIELVA